jgi:DtxR family Mn-dependent transcriptional regulator
MRARIVERLGVSAPAVSETVKRLEREGYLTLAPNRVVQLTDAGRDYATKVMRRHRLAERLLVDVLHVPWSQVHEEAGRLEHAISDRLEAHLVQLLGDPGTCPHGNPIPGSANAVDVGPLVPLASLAPGTDAVVRRIDEELEAQYERMVELEQAGLLPSQRVLMRGAADEQVEVDVDGRVVRLDHPVAALVYVSAAASAA